MQNLKLTYKCPIQLNQLDGEGKIKYCGECAKNVVDFSDKKGKLDIYKNDTKPCGIFKPEQLSEPFGDFRDYFVRFYQKNVEKQKIAKFKFSAVLAVSSILLFLASCSQRRMAGTVYNPHFEDDKETLDSTNSETDKINDNFISLE